MKKECEITLSMKLEQVKAMLLAVTGSTGPDVLEEMGKGSAAYYFLGIQERVQECLDMFAEQGARSGEDKAQQEAIRGIVMGASERGRRA